MKILAIIPARVDSQRYPKKVLKDILGKSMLQRVYENACEVGLFDDVVIATGDEEIINHINDFGAVYFKTKEYHPNGTSRCYEVLRELSKSNDYHFVVNLQADEPMLTKKELIPFIQNLTIMKISTLCTPIKSNETFFTDENIVKVVFNEDREAMYFSRSQIPWHPGKFKGLAYRHIGIYAFRVDTMFFLFDKLKQTPGPKNWLVQSENLEQLTWLVKGYKINLQVIYNYDGISVDTPLDRMEVIRLLKLKQS